MRTATFDRIHFVLSWSALLAVPILFCTPVGDRLEHKFQAWRSGTNTSLKPVAQRAAQVKTEGRDNEMAGNAASRGVNDGASDGYELLEVTRKPPNQQRRKAQAKPTSPAHIQSTREDATPSTTSPPLITRTHSVTHTNMPEAVSLPTPEDPSTSTMNPKTSKLTIVACSYCEVPPSDMGNHSVAAELNDSFLDFTAARGNNLRAAGLTAGCKWCVCAARWREALDASRNSGVGDGVVPKVHLDATHQKALDAVNLDDLKRFAVKKD
ncbi:MAG: hypothetical protein M1831_001749 [Alyxoria varia]|nr:MAG: hypothetical protein M1831_001749 [Alyxoria varia]